MRKLHELTGDEFFDVIGILSPILPVLSELEIIKAQIGGVNQTIADAQETIAIEQRKKAPDRKVIRKMRSIIEGETATVFARDVSKIVPLIATQHRDIAYSLLSIVDEVPTSEVKKYVGPKIMSKLFSVFKETDFRSFLSYAEPPEQGKP